MNTPLLAVTVAVALTLAGCSFIRNPFLDRTDDNVRAAPTRLIEIEVDDLDTGLPCSVVDRPDADTRDVLWRAQFEAGFCHRKAEETRLILQDQGWACRPQNADEREDFARQASTRSKDAPTVVAAWSCVAGLAPIERSISTRPPVPSARPAPSESRAAFWDDRLLRSAVERDLASIGQDVIGEGTAVDAALGDLDEDGVDDAIVALTRKTDRGAPHRLVMAYLQNGEAYNLVDVWILKAPADRDDRKLGLAIEDGKVRLEDQAGPTVLVLNNRKLAYAKDR